MRFDDRIATLLDWDARQPGDRSRIWRQLVDLLARGEALGEGVIADAVGRLLAIEADVAREDRRRTIADLDLARAPAAFLAYLSRDPEASVLSRPIEDGSSPEPAEMVIDTRRHHDDGGQTKPARQIIDLLARIDAFHAQRADHRISGFAFEIDAAGILRARNGADPLAQCAEPSHGVDGQVAGAWRGGVHFGDARLIVERGPYAGEWRISADPLFDHAGRTIGYSGNARAPRADETAVIPPPPTAIPARIDAPGLDAAIDRLRDPLEAIVTAADPAALPPGEVRAAAGEVATRGAALTTAIDTLELAMAAAGDGGLDTAAMLVRIDAALRPIVEARGLKISFRLARGLPPVDADPQAVERMVARLIGAVVALGRRHERIVARLGLDRADGRMLALSVTRPARFTGWPPQALLDLPTLHDAEAPELGLGFALRLVDRLAQEAGGRLAIHHDRIILSLPLPASQRARRRGLS